MKQLGITYEELLDIYAVNGHQVKQPNSVKAIAQALNLVTKRIADHVDKRFESYFNALANLEAKVVELQALAIKAPQQPQRVINGSARMCYCGTVVQGGEQCPVCHARA